VETVNDIHEHLKNYSTNDAWTVWGEWFLADRQTRAISPFSSVTIPQFVENRIQQHTPEALGQADSLTLGNTNLLQQISAARRALVEEK
jgi:hypothetical protein